MDWLMIGVPAVILMGWPVAAILALLLFRTRRRLKHLTQAQERRADALAAGALTPPAPDQQALSHTVEVAPLPAAPALSRSVEVPPLPAAPALSRSVEVPPLPAASWALSTPPQPPSVPFPSTSPSPAASASRPPDTVSYALEPTRPGALERALQAVSGWPVLLAPFLVQSIGWFIGGFCFVAGSIFLVAYTTGFAKALTIFAVIFAYTLGILWGGYQLRRRQPALAMSSSVLMTIGVLLVPLNLSVAVRLILTGRPSAGLIAIGILAAALGLGALYGAITVVSGIMDRALQGRHPHLFLALTAVQLAVPILALLPHWSVLALVHGTLLGLLVYGLVLFTQDWLHSIFVEQRTIAYYAAGTLVYAALVSFVHLTWGYRQSLVLPPGYYGPFLVLLCGVLFYVDAQLKQWMSREAFLSRLSFAIYGLSVLALCLTVAAPTARNLTLFLSIGLYAMVTWQYATLPPLYLLLGCAGWFYHGIILHSLPYPWYFLASLPGFAGLYAGSRWALQRRAASLTLIGYRVLVVSVLAVASWSVCQAQPGLLPMGTALVIMGLAFLGLQYVPAAVFAELDTAASRRHDTRGDWRHSPWLYTATLAGVVAVAYAPVWPGLGWATQFAFGLVFLAQIWTLLGLPPRTPRRGWAGGWANIVPTARARGSAANAPLLNSAVLHLVGFLVIAVALGLPEVTAHRALPLLLALAGGVLLQLSWGLGVQWLFYGVLLLWGSAGVVVKLTYFPAPSAGAAVMFVGLVVWGVLWCVEHEPAEVATLRREQAALRARRQPGLMLLGCVPVSFRPYQDRLRLPLQQAMVLLGIIGLAQVGRAFVTDDLSWAWVISASLGAVLAVLFTGRFCLLGLLPLALTLGLAAWLGVAVKLGVIRATGLGVVGAVYALLVWQASVKLLAHPTTRRLAHTLHLHGDRVRLEHTTHWTTFAMTMLYLVMLGQVGLFTPSLFLLLTLATGMAFMWLAGQRYQHCLHSYVLLGSGALGAVLCYAWAFHTRVAASFSSAWQALLKRHGLGLTLVLVSLCLWAIAWGVTRRLDTEPRSGS